MMFGKPKFLLFLMTPESAGAAGLGDLIGSSDKGAV